MTALPPQNSDRLSRSSSVQDHGKASCVTKPASDSVDNPPSDVSSAPEIRTLVKRQDFLKLAKAKRWVTPAFILQARDRRDDDPIIGAGITASRKVGNAVTRNRAKRRLRVLIREIIPKYCKEGYDLVLIARRQESEIKFETLRRDLKWALKRLDLQRDEKK